METTHELLHLDKRRLVQWKNVKANPQALFV
jgi:hypothetical protein